MTIITNTIQTDVEFDSAQDFTDEQLESIQNAIEENTSIGYVSVIHDLDSLRITIQAFFSSTDTAAEIVNTALAATIPDLIDSIQNIHTGIVGTVRA